jgi:hypothetical protein
MSIFVKLFSVEFFLCKYKKTACYEMLHRATALAGFCEHGNEHSVSIKGGEFPD